MLFPLFLRSGEAVCLADQLSGKFGRLLCLCINVFKCYLTKFPFHDVDEVAKPGVESAITKQP
jgi:hypothetical protein